MTAKKNPTLKVHPEVQAQREASDRRVAKTQGTHVFHGRGTVLMNPKTGATLETDWQNEIKARKAAGWEVVQINPQKQEAPGNAGE